MSARAPWPSKYVLIAERRVIRAAHNGVTKKTSSKLASSRLTWSGAGLFTLPHGR